MRSFCVLLQENYNYQFIINVLKSVLNTYVKQTLIHCYINVIFLCALTRKENYNNYQFIILFSKISFFIINSGKGKRHI